MKRKAYLALSLGTAVLLTLLLVMAIGAQAPDLADGNTIKVPVDYPTIQTAIDAAADGDSILVAAGTYTENLTISEGVILMGGYDANFDHRQPGDSIIDGQGLGRVISITCALSDTLVLVDGFTIMNGDASGLGLPAIPVHEIEAFSSSASDTSAPQIPDSRSPSEQVAELRTQLIALENQELYPGGPSALQAMLDRLDWRTQQAEDAKAKAETHPVQAKGLNQGGAGAGGGIYSWNASPHIVNSVIEYNVATFSGQGLGGGIFIGQAPASAVILANNKIDFNLASWEGEGRGGGLYIAQAPGIAMARNQFGANVASEYGDGFGGGAYIYQSPDVIVEDNWFYENAAVDGDGVSQFNGLGGGLMIYDSQDAVVRGNQVERNTANAAWYSFDGAGGGMFLTVVNGVEVTDNLLRDNLAAINAGAQGGGLQLQYSENALLANNEVTGNWAGMFVPPGEMGGGGMALVDVYSSTVRDNEITDNTSSLVGGLNTLGGGFYGEKMGANSLVTGNVIRGNVACHARCGLGGGGGAFVGDSHEVEVADNTIENNTGGLQDAAGLAGGLLMRNTSNSQVHHNLIQNNTAGDSKGSSSGGLSWDSFFGLSEDITIDGNLILNNQASNDPTAVAENGGVSLWAIQGDVLFSNNVVAGNRASSFGGVLMQNLVNGGAVINNTIVDNGDMGLFVPLGISTALTLENNIIVSHTVGISVSEGSRAQISYTLWDGNDMDTGGAGTITETNPLTGDPAFVDPADHDYHLTIGSAAINAGDPAGVPPAPDQDADGVERPQGSAVDIGAYEWQGYWQHLPLVVNHWQPVVGWAVGDKKDGYGTILHTTDGGNTWTRQGSTADVPNTDLSEVSAVDAQHAWVVGSDAILRTRDGGLTWETQTLPPDLPAGFELHGIKALDANTVYVVGPPSVLLQTTDGTTWTQMPVGADVPGNLGIDVVDAVDTHHVWAVGSIGERTKPAIAFYNGTEWHLQPTDLFTNPETDTFIGVSAIDQLHVWAVGGFSMPLVTTEDSGSTWQISDHPLYPWDMNRVVAVSLTTGWTSGDDGTVKYTTDAGVTWYDVNLPGAYLFGITAMDEKTAWVVGLGVHGVPPGIIARTRDAQHWEVQSDPSWPNMNGISFVGARR